MLYASSVSQNMPARKKKKSVIFLPTVAPRWRPTSDRTVSRITVGCTLMVNNLLLFLKQTNQICYSDPLVL